MYRARLFRSACKKKKKRLKRKKRERKEKKANVRVGCFCSLSTLYGAVQQVFCDLQKKKKQRKNTLNNRKVGEVLLGRVTSVLPSCVCHVILCQQPSHLTSGYSVWRDTQPLLNKISKASKQKTSFKAD